MMTVPGHLHTEIQVLDLPIRKSARSDAGGLQQERVHPCTHLCAWARRAPCYTAHRLPPCSSRIAVRTRNLSTRLLSAHTHSPHRQDPHSSERGAGRFSLSPMCVCNLHMVDFTVMGYHITTGIDVALGTFTMNQQESGVLQARGCGWGDFAYKAVQNTNTLHIKQYKLRTL